MAARIPVVATDIPGCRELVTGHRTGLLFRMDDVSSLRKCLHVCTDPQLRSGLAHAAREFVVENYSAASMARSYQALYRRLAACPDTTQG
jgi:glycosyltransferase involved in cell wall biosynthesis